MLVMLREALPVFESVRFWAALAVPTNWLEKLTFVPESATAGPTPVPARLTVCGLLVALSVMVIVPLIVPGAGGEKVTLIVQFEPALTELPQVFVWP